MHGGDTHVALLGVKENLIREIYFAVVALLMSPTRRSRRCRRGWRAAVVGGSSGLQTPWCNYLVVMELDGVILVPLGLEFTMMSGWHRRWSSWRRSRGCPGYGTGIGSPALTLFGLPGSCRNRVRRRWW
jgi:hypothetical protein